MTGYPNIPSGRSRPRAVIFVGLLILALAIYHFRGPGNAKESKPPVVESAPDLFPPMAPAWVFSRNIPAPGSPKLGLFEESLPRPGFPSDSGNWFLIDQRYRLGDFAYARKMPGWWAEFSAQMGITDTQDDITLVFWGIVASPGGKNWPVVVRLFHRFDGDGNSSGPGPRVHLMVHSFEKGATGWRPHFSGATAVGSMQFQRMESGRLDGSLIQIAIEGTGMLRASETVSRGEIILSLADDGKITSSGPFLTQ